MIQHLLQFVKRPNLYFNLQLQSLLVQVLMAAVDGIHDTASEVHMVILQQNHVKQSDTVVTAAANLHGLLLQHAHARRRLAGVKHAGLRTLQALHIFVRHGGNTTHALHDVQHQTLRLQQRAHAAGDNHGYVALLDT